MTSRPTMPHVRLLTTSCSCFYVPNRPLTYSACRVTASPRSLASLVSVDSAALHRAPKVRLSCLKRQLVPCASAFCPLHVLCSSLPPPRHARHASQASTQKGGARRLLLSSRLPAVGDLAHARHFSHSPTASQGNTTGHG